MNRLATLALLLPLSGCAEPPAPSSPATSEPAAATAAEPASPTPPETSASTPPAAPVAAPVHSAAATPPLATPNALTAPASDAGAPAAQDAPAHKEDAQTAAIRRVGVAARGCWVQHAAGAKGKLLLRLELGADGRVSDARVDQTATSRSLRSAAFEKCVVDVARHETFPAPNADDVELEVPLTFEPST
jgi:outer membrane biosynthesis protein TonB